jgi:glycolate oxidase FAD binding subunit
MSARENPRRPESIHELVDAVRSAPRAIVVGAGTKPRLAAVGAEFARISTAWLTGIVDYEPSEFTFTALAGTPVREIAAALAERGQYLPFDPMFAAAGATLGGTVASGVSGSGRFRFGGLRDFILGVRFVDGEGRLLRMGGKVVKNAAGFDLPKFFVGSAGRFGALAEITFKVFPRPLALRTVRLDGLDAAATTEVFAVAGRARWELDALDYVPAEREVLMRLGGPAEALGELAKEILGRWPGALIEDAAAEGIWHDAGECAWAHAGGPLVKLAITPTALAEFLAATPTEARTRVSAGGNAAWVSLPAGAALPTWAWPAVTLRGSGALWPGAKPRFEIARAVKAALDAGNRFPGVDE